MGKKYAQFAHNELDRHEINPLSTRLSGERSIPEPSGQSFLSDRYDTAIFCFSKGLPLSSAIPCVPEIPFVPAKEAKNRPTLSMR
jgi:hypothetical protein